MRDELNAPERRRYVKPQVVSQHEIEALTGTCEPLGMNTGQDKLAADPNTGVCLNPIT